MWRLSNTFKEALHPRLTRLYGEDQVDRLLERIALVAGRYSYLEERCSLEDPCWDEQTCILITYGDMVVRPGEPGLVTLNRFSRDFLDGLITTIHVLPFFPYSSDDGFSVIDYRQVDEQLGSWDDVETLGQQFRLMFDLVLNHVSSKSKWFQEYLGAIAPARRYFIELDPQTDLSQVVRPRTSPLLTPVSTVKGEKHVWTTFSPDQVDLNFANPDVLLEMLDVLLGYINAGAAIIRLDAIAYLWKEVGTPCINHPFTHEVVKLLRAVVDNVTPGTLLLTETNLPHEENVSYFGAGDEAHIVYQFSLAPLLLHAIHAGTAKHLTRWARDLQPPPPGCTFLNFTASHDGIGVRPLEGLLDEEEIIWLAEIVRQCGGYVSCRTAAGGDEKPYELNITYFDALQDCIHPEDIQQQMSRFLCSQIIMLGFRGIPAVYFHSLFAGRNNHAEVAETGIYRRVNRGRWDDQTLRALLENHQEVTTRIFTVYAELLRKRAGLAAFHPDAEQEVIDGGDALFIFKRIPRKGPPILCVHNVTGEPQDIDIGALFGRKAQFFDHITASLHQQKVRGAPYQCLWFEQRG